MTSLEVLWQEMDADTTSSKAGQLRRRIHPGSSYDLHLTQARPSRMFGFLAAFDGPAGTAWRALQSSRGLSIEVDASAGTRASIQLTEKDPRFHPVFAALVADLVDGLKVVEALPASSRPIPLDFVSGRLQRWQTCLKTSPDGLSDEKQAGLFGELTILREVLVAGLPSNLAVAGWSGSSRAMQDFQYGGSSVEVKASRQTLPTAVRISSERQLDTVAIQDLFLVHVALEPRTDGGGESLPQIVDSARSLVGRDSEAGLGLDERLIEYGYLDVHAQRYGATSYTVRALDCFLVTEGFPRIVEADLIPGVGDVSYLLALAACEDFRVDVQAMLAGIGAARA